jgi:hypothetical protein
MKAIPKRIRKRSKLGKNRLKIAGCPAACPNRFLLSSLIFTRSDSSFPKPVPELRQRTLLRRIRGLRSWEPRSQFGLVVIESCCDSPRIGFKRNLSANAISTTMDVYGNAQMDSKREAHGKVVRMVLKETV